jgi:hypothetical protein
VPNELEHTENPMELFYADQAEQGALARSMGRRAAYRGFRVDVRHGEGFLSVSCIAEPAEPRKDRIRH